LLFHSTTDSRCVVFAESRSTRASPAIATRTAPPGSTRRGQEQKAPAGHRGQGVAVRGRVLRHHKDISYLELRVRVVATRCCPDTIALACVDGQRESRDSRNPKGLSFEDGGHGFSAVLATHEAHVVLNCTA